MAIVLDGTNGIANAKVDAQAVRIAELEGAK
jgi:hypothetical protein